jgi:hypothetical protein
MSVAAQAYVIWGSTQAATRTFDDGLGVRRIGTDVPDGAAVEVLEIAPALAAQPEFEAAIVERVACLSDISIEGIASVRRVERDGATLRVVADHVDGLRLPDLLQEAIKANIPFSQTAVLELAGRILRIVSKLHQVPGLSHGAITPSHVVVTRTGGVVLTDAVYGPALELLQRNREQLWREFRLALPASASLPRFDQRADVAGLGATVLALALGRSLRAGEYPRAINEVVIAATLAARPGETGTSTSALRMWLQESLHLHPRATFASAIDAAKDFDKVLGPAAARRGGAAAFESSVRRIFGDTPQSAEAAKVATAWSPAAVPTLHPAFEPLVSPVQPFEPVPVPVPQSPPARAFSTLVRSVFATLRA